MVGSSLFIVKHTFCLINNQRNKCIKEQISDVRGKQSSYFLEFQTGHLEKLKSHQNPSGECYKFSMCDSKRLNICDLNSLGNIQVSTDLFIVFNVLHVTDFLRGTEKASFWL